MELIEVTSKKHIVLVCGKLCSGKGHYSQQYFLNYKIITVSDIVRKFSNFHSRSELSATKKLDQKIADELIEMIKPYNKVVVDGIRQISIMKQLQKYFGSDIQDIIWLDVDNEILKSRFYKRNASKDDTSFEEALKIDQELGIDEIEDYIRKNHRVIPYNGD